MVADLQPTGADALAEVFDCWNTIGVTGNGSCRELLRFTHCRNCPVHSAAAAQLLDRPVLPQWRDEWTEHYAREKKLTTPARTSVVIFRIGPEWLALPTPAFQEVAERRIIHTLPRRRSVQNLVLGLVNIRGELLICVALGPLLGLEASTLRSRPPTARDPATLRSGLPTASEPDTAATEDGRKSSGLSRLKSNLDLRLSERLLVTIWDGQRLVFPVDEVQGIRRVQHDELRDPPATLVLSGRSCMRGIFPWRNLTVGLLAADVLFATLNRNLS